MTIKPFMQYNKKRTLPATKNPIGTYVTAIKRQRRPTAVKKLCVAADMHFTCRDGEEYNHNDNT